MIARLAPFLLLLFSPASAQVSGCVRDANGALQCGLRSSPGEARTAAPSGNAARRAQQLEASRRQAQALQAERDARDKEAREAGERRGAERQNCIARAQGDPAALGACPL
jgi:hypothetical protein